LLLREDCLKGDCGVAVTATGVMKKDVNVFHVRIVTPVLQFRTRHATCHVNNRSKWFVLNEFHEHVHASFACSSPIVHINPSK
jgi:hypothetical protein